MKIKGHHIKNGYNCIKNCGNRVCQNGRQCKSCAQKGKNNHNFGKKLSEETRRKQSLAKKGLRGNNYKDGRTSIVIQIRNLKEYRDWRKSIFTRDNFACKECNYKGKKIEAHHEKSFNKIFIEFIREYNQFSIIEDKETLVRLSITYKPFWDISNGKTLCSECHRLISTKIT